MIYMVKLKRLDQSCPRCGNMKLHVVASHQHMTDGEGKFTIRRVGDRFVKCDNCSYRLPGEPSGTT